MTQVHGYEGAGGNRSGLYKLAVVEGRKILRNSEHGDGDGSGATIASQARVVVCSPSCPLGSWCRLEVEDALLRLGWCSAQAAQDLAELRPTGFAYWQARRRGRARLHSPALRARQLCARACRRLTFLVGVCSRRT